MHHPLPITHRKGVILRDLQIVHRLRARHNLPASDHADLAVGSSHMHAYGDLAHRQEALLDGQEGVLLVGMHDLAGGGRGRAVLTLDGRGGDRQVDQVVVAVDPDVQHWLLFHRVRLGVVGQHLGAYVQRADGLLAMIGSHLRQEREATGRVRH